MPGLYVAMSVQYSKMDAEQGKRLLDRSKSEERAHTQGEVDKAQNNHNSAVAERDKAIQANGAYEPAEACLPML